MKKFLLILFVFVVGCPKAQDLSVEKIWKNYEFFAKGVEGFRSMNDGVHFTKVSSTESGDNITKHHFEHYTGSGDLLVSNVDIGHIKIDDYEFNHDESKVLIATQSQAIYRHSYEAIFFLYDIKAKLFKELDASHRPQTLARFSPDGTKISYIHKNNLYVKDLLTDKVKQLTKDGEINSIINGTTDWVYEEEFAFIEAYGWSPDSKWIAFLKFDEREVPEFDMTFYGDLYPELYTFKYPKAGEVNSKVSAHLIQAKGGKSQKIELGEYEYIPRLKWSGSSNQLIIQTLNRHQNHLKYHLISLVKKKHESRVIYEEKDKAYIDIDDNLLILSDGKGLLRTSEKDEFKHCYQLNFDGTQRQLTNGDWDLIDLYGIDEKNQYLYYSSAESGAIYKSIYRIRLDGSGKELLSSEKGYNDASFSIGMKYFIKTFSSANTPPVYILCNAEGKELTVLENNFKLLEKLSSYHLSTKEFITFEGNDYNLNGWIIKPKNFDPTKKYPVYMNVYGGPGSNMVSDSWDGLDFMYHQLLAQNGYVIISVDPRGTMYRGAAFKKATYLQLGKLETEDLIAVAKELGSYDFVDPERIGIMGWSYGGFMSSLALTKGADYFKMGIAVAPVTNWRYYDNIYTERFMRTPRENGEGYDQNSPINHVAKLKGNYLLIHGSGDDNVHYQNTMEMINAMVKANKQFDLFIYPNRNHGIYGGNTRNHLFQMLFDYTIKNL